jgi:esterase/lipase superfamily enzyme
MSGDLLTQAISAEWEGIASAVGSARAEFEAELTRLLRELEAHPDDRPTIDAIFALFRRYPAADKILADRLAGMGVAKGTQHRGLLEQRVRYTTVPVFFGTSRAPTGSANPADYFGTSRADNSFGIVNVSIPDDHRMGALEKPRWFKLEFRADPEKHVLVLSVEPLDRSQFATRGRSEIAGLKKKEVLIFVHGYNVTFGDAARRAAQISYDLNFDGLPALYSWPSEGSVAKYLVDANNVSWAEPHFRDFLRIVREELGADAVHVIAHSMGTRLLANTIVSLTSVPAAPGALRQIVFAAPDIDADTFRNLSAAFRGRAARITLYASSGDRALSASQQFQKYSRAGQSGLDLVVVPTVDTIDASAVKTEFLGHSYFGDTDSVLSDLFYLIRDGTPPSERARLRERSRYGSAYWEFKSVRE